MRMGNHLQAGRPCRECRLEGTTDVSQQSEIQTYYTLQTFLGIHVEPEMVDAARVFTFFCETLHAKLLTHPMLNNLLNT